LNAWELIEVLFEYKYKEKSVKKIESRYEEAKLL